MAEQDSGAPFGTGSHAAHEAPAGLRPSGFDPSRWTKPSHSPNLFRWIAKQRRTRLRPPTVFRDLDGARWIGWVDDETWFIGARLARCLTVGGKAEVYAHPGKALQLTEEQGFWTRYSEIGRCAIDEAHQTGFIGSETRWEVDGDTRRCLWCGNHTQQKRRWTETVERSRWEPCASDGSPEGRDAQRLDAEGMTARAREGIAGKAVA